MEIKYKYHRTDTISSWRCSGVVYEDFNELYYTYIRTLKCSHCNKEFKNSKDRCLDHDHETGLFRAIVCQNCNKCDSYIKYPNGYDKKKAKKEYYEANKEKCKVNQKEYYEKNKEKINKIYNCDCGGKYKHRNKKKHLGTIKHIAWFMEQVD